MTLIDLVPFFNLVGFVLGTYINTQTKRRRRLAALKKQVHPSITIRLCFQGRGREEAVEVSDRLERTRSELKWFCVDTFIPCSPCLTLPHRTASLCDCTTAINTASHKFDYCLKNIHADLEYHPLSLVFPCT